MNKQYNLQANFHMAPDENKNMITRIENGESLQKGDVLTFTASGSEMENLFTKESDERFVPVSWSVNPSAAPTIIPKAPAPIEEVSFGGLG